MGVFYNINITSKFTFLCSFSSSSVTALDILYELDPVLVGIFKKKKYKYITSNSLEGVLKKDHV